VADWSYPPEVSRLYGDEAASADPYALFEPYHGEPLRQVGTHLFEEEQEAFEVSLLTGLCWIAAAGIAHRGLSPDTVLWDSQLRRVQITDFSLSTVFGAPRKAVMGPPDWVAREQRPGKVSGRVSERDDIWAAGRLIFFVRNQGEELADRGQIAASGLGDLLDGVFGPPEGRPTATELLVNRLRRRNPVPRGAAAGSERLREGRRRFWDTRTRKHPTAPLPPEAAEDADGADGPAGTGALAPASPEPVSTGPFSAAPADPGARDDGTARDRDTARSRQFPWRRGGG
jgi:serine/threonine protein kinase